MSFALSLTGDVVEAEAGATTPVGLTVVNRGSAADRFEVEVEGIDPEWRFIPVPTFAVEPGESRSEKVFLKPPRLPESVAGSYPFVVRVRSLESGETRTAQGLLKLRAFHHVTMEIAPKKGVVSPTTKRNDFRLTIVNLGNSEQTLQLTAQDPEDRCAFEFENDQLVLGPGQQREVEVVADPKQKPLLSSGRLIGFSVFARSLNERSVTATAQAQLEQRSLLSPATLVVVALLAAVIGVWWMMRPTPPSLQLSVNPPHALRGSDIQVRIAAQGVDRVTVKMGETEIYNGPPTSAPISAKLEGTGLATFVATATRDGHSEAEDTKRVVVDEPVVAPPPKIDGLKISDKRIKLGTSFIVTWKASNATKVAITPVEDSLDPALGSQAIKPDTTGNHDYKFIAYNADGKTVSQSFTVSVYDESDASIISFAASPAIAKEEEGGKTTLSWLVTGAVQIELKIGANAPTTVDPRGSQEVTLTAKTPCTLTAVDDKNRRVTRRIVVDYEKAEIVYEPSTTSPANDPAFPDKVPPITNNPPQ